MKKLVLSLSLVLLSPVLPQHLQPFRKKFVSVTDPDLCAVRIEKCTG